MRQDIQLKKLPVAWQVSRFDQIDGEVLGNLRPQFPPPVPVDTMASALMRSMVVNVPGSIELIVSYRRLDGGSCMCVIAIIEVSFISLRPAILFL